MKMIAKILTGLIALQHLLFLVVEMFLWEHSIGRSMFKTTAEFAAESAFMAQNQGLYNGFLAAGLVWALIAAKRDVRVFFLACVLIAGIFGAFTVSPTIFVVQGIPALLALILTTMKR